MQIYIFSFILAIYAIQTRGLIDYMETAVSLNNSIKYAFDNIKELQANLEKQTKTPVALGIKLQDQPGIVNLRNELMTKANKDGFQSCNETLINSTLILESVLRALVAARMTESATILFQLTFNLTYIQNRLSGDALNEELKSCQMTSGKCKITGNYTDTVTNAQSFLISNCKKLSAANVANEITQSKIVPQLPMYIQKNVAQPVEKCLQSIK